MKILHRLAKLLAVLAGGLLVCIMLMTCASLVGRNFLSLSLSGDFELTGLAVGATIALFMPYSQATRSHISVNFFTVQLSAAKQDMLDRFGTLLLALLFALLAWRTALGGLNSHDTHTESQILGLPLWLVYAVMVPAFALTALIGLGQTLFGLKPVETASETGAKKALQA